jgi:hypothetical protein
MNLFEITLKTN